MNHPEWTRRRFIRATGAAGLAATMPAHAAAEPPLETTRIRIEDRPIACLAPLHVAEPLLRAEGFTEIEYVKVVPLAEGPVKACAAGQIDLIQTDPVDYMQGLDRGAPIVVLGGMHTGCWELFGQRAIHTLRELKGKTIAAPEKSSRQAFVAAMIASVGLDPHRDVTWINHDTSESMRLFEQGRIDAFMGFVPEPQVLRARKVGQVLIDTLIDKPWSQYFCCLAGANREFVRKHPVATRRALRAVLKAIDLCVSQPERAARLMVERGVVAPNFEHVLQAVKDVGYAKWRDYEAEDTMRFWGLRLREFGFVKSDPKKLLAKGTDWRFIEQLKKEMKT
ncbi:MAG: ABC transporter substrate-binding protein [Burkholderiaceae bacterium]